MHQNGVININKEQLRVAAQAVRKGDARALQSRVEAEVAFVLTMTQGWGPATSLSPAIDRLAGMIGAIILLAAVNFLFGPAKELRL